MTAVRGRRARHDIGPGIAAVEIGGSGVQTTIFDGDGVVVDVVEHARRPEGMRLAIAVPGVVKGRGLVDAGNLGWRDVDPVRALGLSGEADLVCNDAHAAALGEASLRSVDDLLFLGLGTGVGGILLRKGRPVAMELGHTRSFSDRRCTCGRLGCLETVAAGWALPAVLRDADLDDLAARLADLVDDPFLETPLVVLAGGITRGYPTLVDRVRARCGRTLEGTAAPLHAKSAAPWGLIAALATIDA